jgi:hypothetical protein
MDQRTIQILFALLRSAICGTKLTEKEQNIYSPDMLQDLLKISSKHDVVHLLVLGLKQNELIAKENAEIEKCILKAVYRYEKLNYELKQVCETLEKVQIPFLPLKGSVIRKYYPEAWMRTSCDIDVLVHDNDAEKAKSVLVNEYGYVYHWKGSHDISLFAPTNTHIELHYDLVEDGIANESSEVLKNVWDMSVIREGYAFWYEMPDDYYYFYHIAHMAKHFENGGCGIRPFIDLLILDGIQGADIEKRDKLLWQGNLLKFANVARKQSRIWFSDEPYDFISQQMEDYILRGGVYGNNENRIIVQQQKKGGRLKYVLSKIFIPYDVIKFHYPILQKHRWLTPIMEVRRWCKLIFCGHLKRTAKEIQYNNRITNDEAAGVQNFLESIGL